MIRNGNSVSDLKIAYIGGGSRGWAWGLMSDLASEESLSGTVYLYDIDHKASQTNEVIGNSNSTNWKYIAEDNIGKALKDSDFVIISVLPGTFDEMESDVHTPEKYGVYQSVGDTTGPGGVIRAMRTLPMYVEFANAIKEYCPNAWVINYTNPMAVCISTLYKVFPQIKAFGCCHEVFGTQELLLKALKEKTGIEDIKRTDIHTNVIGINHFTWVNKAQYKDIDLIPIYSEFADKYYADGYVDDKPDHWMNKYFGSAQRVKFDLFKRFGVIAAAGDRHLAEFCPSNWYLKDDETVESWKFGCTPVSWRKEDLQKRIDRAIKLESGEEKFELKPTGEEGINQIKAILGLGNIVTNVNIPNMGQISNVPLGTVVETNAIFTHDTVVPQLAGDIPDDILGIMSPSIYNQRVITDACLKKDTNLIFTAFINDRLMNSVSLSDSKKLFIEMFENTKSYLNGWEDIK